MDSEIGGDVAGVLRTCSAEGKEREIIRLVTFGEGYRADGFRHLLNGDGTKSF